jgi:hypothetical protein
MSYDSTEDVRKHRKMVRIIADTLATALTGQVESHDLSKLQEPEKSMFDQWVPELKVRAYGSPEYMNALEQMGEGLKHHYKHNRHHPDFFENGVAGMDLIDLSEMICDWYASAKAKGSNVDMAYSQRRFNLDPQLASIIGNTIAWLERYDKDNE